MFQSSYSKMSNDIITKKLIPVDFDFKLDDDTECSDEDNTNNDIRNKKLEKDSFTAKNYISTKNSNICAYDCSVNLFSTDWKQLNLTKYEYYQFCDSRLQSYDLAIEYPLKRICRNKYGQQRKIISTLLGESCLSSSSYSSNYNKNNALSSSIYKHTNIDTELSASKKPIPKPRNKMDDIDINEHIDTKKKQIQKLSLDEILFQEKLSLTLEEIIHIRNVLTNAELESLPIEGRVKEDVEKRRVCFLCLKTRFSLLGPWGQRCRLCGRTVCIKCYSKMRIPIDNFANIPILLLTPGLIPTMSTRNLNTDVINSSTNSMRLIDSAPTSPAKFYDSEIRNTLTVKTPIKFYRNQTYIKPLSKPAEISSEECLLFKKRSSSRSNGNPYKLLNTATFGVLGRKTQERSIENYYGKPIAVCYDCRMMVIQTIKSSRLTRTNIRNDIISRLTLNLSPAYN